MSAVAVIFLPCFFALTFSGCNGIRESKQIRWVVSFHLQARAAEGENLSVTSVRDLVSDDVYLIRKLPLASSRYILTGELIEEAGEVVAIKFTMDPFDRMKWMQITTEYGGRQVAVCVDGYYRFMWRVPYRYDTDTHQIVVRGPWDRREAELIVEWAPRNYSNLANDPVSPRKKD